MINADNEYGLVFLYGLNSSLDTLQFESFNIPFYQSRYHGIIFAYEPINRCYPNHFSIICIIPNKRTGTSFIGYFQIALHFAYAGFNRIDFVSQIVQAYGFKKLAVVLFNRFENMDLSWIEFLGENDGRIAHETSAIQNVTSAHPL